MRILSATRLSGWLLLAWCLGSGTRAQGQDPGSPREQLERYFRRETEVLTAQSLSQIRTAEDWSSQQAIYRRQLAEMLGLEPAPPRTDLQPVVTGTVDDQDVIVENLHFQSLPGLYVTGNFYRPREQDQPLPAILYLCGHARVAEGDVSYGNKTAYHHHGLWFARHGYVCLTIDTIQLGEIEGDHHGTHRLNQWWWNSRGYTPAGVEAWNAIRALDYLEQRPEVDPARIGVTGRSGGGAYTWWVAALDTRVAAAVPVAGITSLRNHVVDGCVSGHCDCMYPVNTYRWDFPQIAALVAPRPLLIANSDNDTIFPLDGVIDVHARVRRIYDLLGASDRLGLCITPGPHTDTQELQVPAFRWFNKHLRDTEVPVERATEKVFTPEQLRVLEAWPADQRVTRIQHEFVPAVPDTPLPRHWLPAETAAVKTAAAETATAETARADDLLATEVLPRFAANDTVTWPQLAAAAEAVQAQLAQQVFRGWPSADRLPALDVARAGTAEHAGWRFQQLEFNSQADVRLSLYVWQPLDLPPAESSAAERTKSPAEIALALYHAPRDQVVLAAWQALAAGVTWERLSPEQQLAIQDRLATWRSENPAVFVCFAPRGMGPAAWEASATEQIHIRRRFMLLGQTLAGMQVWDIRRGLQVLRQAYPDYPQVLEGAGADGGLLLWTALGQPGVSRLLLHDPPPGHAAGHDLLNAAKVIEPRQLVSLLLAEGTQVSLLLSAPQATAWEELRTALPRLAAEETGRGRLLLVRLPELSP